MITTAATIDLITLSWVIETLPAWRTISATLIIVAGIIGTPFVSGWTLTIGSKRGIPRTARAAIAVATGTICAAASLVGSISLLGGGHEIQQRSLSYLELEGTTATISVMETISEANAGPARLGIRLQEHPQLLLSVDGDDVDRFIGTEGTRATVSCNAPEGGLSSPATLSCSSTPPVAGEYDGLAGLLGLAGNPAEAVTATRTPIELELNG